jgi:hypothetical protein
MALSEECTGRLANWKFAQAAALLDGDCEPGERELVEALAALLGDCGWLPGGSLAVVVSEALAPLIGDGEQGARR